MLNDENQIFTLLNIQNLNFKFIKSQYPYIFETLYPDRQILDKFKMRYRHQARFLQKTSNGYIGGTLS